MERSRPPVAGLLDAGAPVAVAALYFAAVALFYPLRAAFEIDPDEGVHAMLALLIARGHALYSEAWFDHAPLLPHLLRVWFDVFGWDVATGRLLILLFSAAIVFALYDSVRRAASHRAALATVFFLCTSSHFVPLSVALMTSLPSIAFAVLSVWALTLVTRKRPGWLEAAGLLMAASLGVKLMTAFLLPLIAVWATTLARRRGAARPLAVGMLWLVFALGQVAVLLLVFVGVENLHQLAAAATATGALSRFGILGLGSPALQDWPLVVLAAIGSLLIVRRRTVELALWPLWVAVTLAILIGYAPVWYHHYLLLSVAAAPCAGVALAAAWRPDCWSAWRRGDPAQTAAALAAAVAAGWMVVTLPGTGKLSARVPLLAAGQGEPVVAAMRGLADRARFVVTDAPMFAFRAGLTVVPEIAVITGKRMAAGDLTAADVLAAIDRRAPEQILLTGRFTAPIHDAVIEAIRDRYRLVPAGPAEPAISLYTIREPSR